MQKDEMHAAMPTPLHLSHQSATSLADDPSFLGLVKYYHWFVPNFASIATLFQI